MAKLSNRGQYFFKHLADASQSSWGGVYAEAQAMLEAVTAWADFNNDDWLYLPSNPKGIGDVKFAEMQEILKQRVQEVEQMLASTR